MKKALITGITGQDGAYLAEFLLNKGYEVHGIIRRSSSFNTNRVEHLYRDPHDTGSRFHLHYGDLNDASSLFRVLKTVVPDEVYNLAAQSHVKTSFEIPDYTADVVGLGAMRLLDCIRDLGLDARFYQASSSEMFGKVLEVPQKESTPFYPRSPYACAKVFAYWTTINYREAYNIHASNGILFNHESPLRGERFVTRKITRALSKILAKKQDKLYLGNLDSKRDWGYAKDYVEAMWLVLQQEKPDDYVIATGKTYSVKDFLIEAFGLVNLQWEKFVEIDKKYFRPTEVDLLVGDSSKAARQLGWTPKTDFSELVKIMLSDDLRLEGLDPEKYFGH